MPTHKHSRSSRASTRKRSRSAARKTAAPSAHLPALVIGSLCMVASFAVGIESAGDVKTVGALQAAAVQQALPGDMNGDGAVTATDALLAAEAIRSGAELSPAMADADPSQDAHLTLDDLLFILRHAAR